MRRLIDTGYVEREHTYTGTLRTGTIYTIHVIDHAQDQRVPARRINAHTSAQDQRPMCAQDQRAIPSLQTGETVEIEKDKGDALIQRDEFDEWYATYPRKKGRGAAAKAYAKARKQATADQLTDGLAAAVTDWTRRATKPEYIPHPATWLNQQRWLDEADRCHDVTEARVRRIFEL